ISSAAVSDLGPDGPRRAASLCPTEWCRRVPSETFGEIALLSPGFRVSAQPPALHLARKCREFRNIPAETNGGPRKPRCVVAEAVCSELVSAWEIPDLQGIIREFSMKVEFLNPISPANSRKSLQFFGKFPENLNSEFSGAEQGMDFSLQRDPSRS